MRDRVKAAKVGALVLAALIAAFVVWRLVDETAGTEGGRRACAEFTNAHGLITKSRVTVAGIPVGYIEGIRLVGNRARVDMIIDEQVDIRQNATINRRSASLLGEYLLAIEPGGPPSPPLRRGCIQVSEETADTADILRDVGAIARSLRRVADQLGRAFGDDRAGDQMASALENLSEALEAVNRTIQANEQAVTTTLQNIEDITSDAAPRLEEILENVEVVTGDVRQIIEQNRDGLDEGVGEVGPTIASINRAAQQLERVLEDVGEITERTAAGEGTVGRLTSDEHLIDEVEETVEGINEIVGGFARLQTIVGLRSEYLFLANAFKNYLEVRIQPAEDRYIMIQLIDDPRGSTRFTTTQVRTSPPREGEPAYYEEVRAETSESLLFSLQLAKRLYFVTLRFGILESSGGIGLDLHFFDDRLEINADLFAFGDQTYPNLRVRIGYEIVRTLFVIGGVDNILNIDPNVPAQNGADFSLLGAMLRFNDQDLTGLLPLLGGVGGAAN